MTQTQGTFEGWVILELLGHRKLGGYLSEQAIASATFLRLDIMGHDQKVVASQFYSPGAVYCITPVSEQLARQYGLTHQPQPITCWELPISPDSDAEKWRFDDCDRERNDDDY